MMYLLTVKFPTERGEQTLTFNVDGLDAVNAIKARAAYIGYTVESDGVADELTAASLAWRIAVIQRQNTFAAHGWTEAKHVGDAVLSKTFRKGDDLGTVEIRDFCMVSGGYHIAAFLPGREVFNEGDTPKTEPNFDAWVSPNCKIAAERRFHEFCEAARATGWTLAAGNHVNGNAAAHKRT